MIDLTKPIALLAATVLVVFVIAGFVLLGQVDFGSCMDVVRGHRARFVQQYVCSPRLLNDGAREWFVFAWLWSFPAVLLFLSYRLSRKTVRSE